MSGSHLQSQVISVILVDGTSTCINTLVVDVISQVSGDDIGRLSVKPNIHVHCRCYWL